ncbi:MAG: twin-arginine translocase subunit TatC [Myxococcota bacterium]
MSVGEELPEMSLFDHLDELRKRLISTVVVLILVTLGCFSIAPVLFDWLQLPLRDISDQQLQVLDPVEMFVTYLKLSALAAVFVSAPWILLQVWLFVAPGLYAAEKRWVVPFIFLGSLFFIGGGAFGFYIVIPNAFQFLTGMVPESVDASYSVQRYFSLVIRLLLAFGIVFELPLVMWILSAAGIVNPSVYVKLRKYWFVAAVVLGAMLTDPSPMTQAMMAVPLVVFWELGIIGGKILYPRRK